MKLKLDWNVERAKRRLQRAAQKIDKVINEVPKDVATIGWGYARNLAPVYSGELVSMIIFREEAEGWVIISQGEHSSNLTPSLNVQFDEGTYPKARRESSLRFMQQTEEFLRNEFENRLNLEINKIVTEV
jgi:hypothetical protein